LFFYFWNRTGNPYQLDGKRSTKRRKEEQRRRFGIKHLNPFENQKKKGTLGTYEKKDLDRAKEKKDLKEIL
jgi:hypothetical protein